MSTNGLRVFTGLAFNYHLGHAADKVTRACKQTIFDHCLSGYGGTATEVQDSRSNPINISLRESGNRCRIPWTQIRLAAPPPWGALPLMGQKSLVNCYSGATKQSQFPFGLIQSAASRSRTRSIDPDAAESNIGLYAAGPLFLSRHHIKGPGFGSVPARRKADYKQKSDELLQRHRPPIGLVRY